MNLKHRLELFQNISNSLSYHSNSSLSKIIKQSEDHHSGFGGKASLIEIDGKKVFVKRIPLTDLELEPQNVMSTQNLFHLPCHYQYGIGSAGLNAWRDLITHKVTTSEVLIRYFPHFPLMYHWRVLSNEPQEIQLPTTWDNFEDYYAYWDHSREIIHRIQSINNSKYSIVMFLEYFPYNLHDWLVSHLQSGSGNLCVLEKLCADIDFINDKLEEMGFIHFDQHFKNFLTDGDDVVLCDFGLATSKHFDLNVAERVFYDSHKKFDHECSALHILYNVFRVLFGEDQWAKKLNQYASGEKGFVSPDLERVILQLVPKALNIDKFFESLKVNKKTVYKPSSPICLPDSI